MILAGADAHLPHSHQAVCVASKQSLAISRSGQRGTLGWLKRQRVLVTVALSAAVRQGQPRRILLMLVLLERA